MKEHFIKVIENTRIEFATLSKRNILSIFNYKCKTIHEIEEEELEIIDGKLCLPIDLSSWIDIDDNTCFINVLNVLEKITNPKSGNPALIIKARLVGWDVEKQESFIFEDTFIDGIHSIIGEYSNGEKMFYTNKLYLE